MDVAAGGEQFVYERSAFLLGPQIMWAQEVHQIALGLIGEHLDEVGQVLTFGGESDHGLFAKIADLNTCKKATTLVEEFAQSVPSGAQVLAELAVGDLEPAHGGTVLLGVVGGGRSVLPLELGELATGGSDLFVQCAPLWGLGTVRVGSSGSMR